jgi:hypothetical protein
MKPFTRILFAMTGLLLAGTLACRLSKVEPPPSSTPAVAQLPTLTLTVEPPAIQTHTSTPSAIPSLTPTSTATATPTKSFTPTFTPTFTQTPSPTVSRTSTQTLSPTVTNTPTITPTPTFAFPTVKVLMQANCRYGPGKAYLYAWGMYAGDTGVVWGRNEAGTWLWIQPDNIKYQCWISASVVEVTGDIFSVLVRAVTLPHTELYGPPTSVGAVRDGNNVIVSWSPVWMTEDDYVGYLIEATVCQGGQLVWMAVATTDTTYTFTDEAGCSGPSSGKLYAVDKHGYTDPVTIPWP